MARRRLCVDDSAFFVLRPTRPKPHTRVLSARERAARLRAKRSPHEHRETRAAVKLLGAKQCPGRKLIIRSSIIIYAPCRVLWLYLYFLEPPAKPARPAIPRRCFTVGATTSGAFAPDERINAAEFVPGREMNLPVFERKR